ncbi:mitochondrial carrier domain-containing protein [Lineolata rhizophorae]|uniref:Mitochondrial thiamine pyrophosphate carrier 1 n=1 Tax=Lineolata rhizophorae TaxID=578093 RepID=A0A6A6P851_9PEZI|nr:mitochondrial carrier domain-containing protein [Lineolata rhizophorae]
MASDGSVKALKDEGTPTQVAAAGAIAGLVSRFVIAPLDVIKIRLQLQTHSLSDPLSVASAQGGPIYKGTFGTLKHILRDEGITAFWKGNIPAEFLYLSYGSVQFLTYRRTSAFLSSLPPPLGPPPEPFLSFAAGALAGSVATSATYPLDLLRTRFAAQGRDRYYAGLRHAARSISAHEGARGWFAGVGAAVVQIVPYMGLFFAAYEGLKPALAGAGAPLQALGSGDAVAGTVASVFAKTAVFPLDTVRKRLQVQGPSRGAYVHRNIPIYQGVYRTVRSILQREGPRGLYRGLSVSLLKAAPASAVTMWTYERAVGAMVLMERKIADIVD